MNSLPQNPVDLLQRLSALVEDLPKVQEEWRRVMMAKQVIHSPHQNPRES